MAAPQSTIRNISVDTLPIPKEQRRLSAGLFQRLTTCIEVMLDVLTGLAGFYLGYVIYYFLHIGRHIDYPAKEIAVVGFVLGLLIALLLGNDGAYRGSASLLRIRETERAIRIPAQAMLLLFPVTLVLNRPLSRATLFFTFIVTPILLVMQKHTFFTVVRRLHAIGIGTERVLIYGAGYTGKRVLSALLHSPKLGMRPFAIIDDDPALVGQEVFELGYRRLRSVPIFHGPISVSLLKNWRCDRLVIAIPSLSLEKFSKISDAAREAGIQVAFLRGTAVEDHYGMESIDIDGLLLTTLSSAIMPWHYRFTKRAFDVTVSLLLLLLASPALLLIALLVRLDSPGPILFVQERVGRNGRLFKMYKFRSMRVDAPKYSFSPTESTDPRITRFGRFLRRTSLDEVPQLLNVLVGEMSLVGPRPEMPFIVERYDSRQKQRLHVVPGITGLWQLSADRSAQIHECIQYDLYYIRNRALCMDLAILVHTAFFAMHGI